MDGVQPHNVLRVGAQHQHRNLVVDLLGAALAAAPPAQELGGIVDAGFLVDRSPNDAVLSSVEWGEGRIRKEEVSMVFKRSNY